MKKLALASLMVAHTCLVTGAMAQGLPGLSVKLDGIENGQPIDTKFAYCMPDGNGATKNGGNSNPAISWSGAPAGTKSFSLIVVDPDVPASFELANKAGKTIPADFGRRNFYHWVLADIPTATTSIAEGADSKGVAAKPTGKTAYGVNGQNDYGDGQGGYNGPCPPWNDERLHHYHFVVYALDVSSLGLTGNFGGKQAEDAMTGHILAKGEIVGTYTNNPTVK